MTETNPISYTIIQYSLITDQILQKCSTLFNNNYGVWNNNASLHSNNVLQTGSRVKLGVKRLRELMLFNDRCFLVVAEIRSLEKDQFELIGHAFSTYVNYNRLNGNVVWITQLVVCSTCRGRGVAGTLLSLAKNNIQDVVAMGLASSHPYAVMALCNACNRIPINLKFIADHAKDIIEICKIPYISRSQVIGSIFDKQSSQMVDIDEQPVSLIKTDFFVDHKEVLTILEKIQQTWILGPLLEGHEFVIILPTTSVRRSRTPSNTFSSNSSPLEKQPSM
ncbi:unnamed protein product [Adineta ricciae]|uniref:N-acetyltransferase domain-containing protein n=1 Tax=Adineta ricciae TaxID=249248 RepID=A0A815P7P6_ADIRI|nr:unnamed protein product [Adineta ricciae]CAF1445368.1 unnamed protein product [Adineta ricciae]